ncbi:hypothetical protein ACJ5XU_001562, partial [Providencia stuartii]
SLSRIYFLRKKYRVNYIDIKWSDHMNPIVVKTRKNLLRLQAKYLAQNKGITIDDAFDLLLKPNNNAKNSLTYTHRVRKGRRQHQPSSLLTGLFNKTYVRDWTKTK